MRNFQITTKDVDRLVNEARRSFVLTGAAGYIRNSSVESRFRRILRDIVGREVNYALCNLPD